MAIVTENNMSEKIAEAKSLLDYLSITHEETARIINLVQKNQDWFDARPGGDALKAARRKLERILGEDES